MLQSTKEVRIAFHRMVDKATAQPVTDVDWGARLPSTLRRSVDYSGRDLEGLVIESGPLPAIALSTDRAFAPRQRNTATGQRSTVRITDGHEPIEETFVRFFEQGVVGIARSSNSAPHPAAVAKWLTGAVGGPVQGDDKSRWDIDPVLHSDTIDGLEGAKVSKMTLGIKADELANLPERSFIRELFGSLRNTVQTGMRVEITITARRGEVGNDSRELVHELLDAAVPEISVVDKATVSAVRADAATAEVVNLLQDRLTTSVVVPVRDRALDEASVLREILRAYNECRDEIDRSIGQADATVTASG